MDKFSSIDHCFISRSQIFETYIIESILENYHSTLVYQSSFKLEWKQQNTEDLMKDRKRYTRSKFNRDIALQDWLLMYKIKGANEIFHKFIEIFQNVLNSHAPLKNIEVKTKKEIKKWLSKELRSLINEKHRVFNEWKKDPNQELFISYKVLRNNVNRKLRKASDDYTKQFFENLPTSKGQWRFIKNKNNSNKQTEKLQSGKRAIT